MKAIREGDRLTIEIPCLRALPRRKQKLAVKSYTILKYQKNVILSCENSNFRGAKTGLL